MLMHTYLITNNGNVHQYITTALQTMLLSDIICILNSNCVYKQNN